MSTDDPADIYSKSYLQAANILQDLADVGSGLISGIDALGIIVATLETTEEFSKDTRTELQDAIAEVSVIHTQLGRYLSQVLADIDVISRAIVESTDLGKQTKNRLATTSQTFQKIQSNAAAHLNTTANAVTVAGGREYLMLEGERLRRVLELVEVEALNAELLHLDTTRFKELERAVETAAIVRKNIGVDPIGGEG